MRYAESFPSETNLRIELSEIPRYSAAALDDSNRDRLGGVDAGEDAAEDAAGRSAGGVG